MWLGVNNDTVDSISIRLISCISMHSDLNYMTESLWSELLDVLKLS